MSAIGIGIVGCGKIARDQHIPAIAANRRLALLATADPASSYENVPSYPGLAQMIAAHPEMAAVSLCMPPRFRAAAAREAIAAGLHVLLEKPPAATLAEAEELAWRAREAGVTLFTAWHSQEGAAVRPAKDKLATAHVRSVRVTWKEDVRVWHPGQPWIWQSGGFGVFDPGINALSILTAILPGDLTLESAELEVPANAETPIAARLALRGESGFPVTADFDFRQTGPQSWDIVVETDRGEVKLSRGGNILELDGVAQTGCAEAEYGRLYARFASLIDGRESDVCLEPLALAEAALARGSVRTSDAFEERAAEPCFNHGEDPER